MILEVLWMSRKKRGESQFFKAYVDKYLVNQVYQKKATGFKGLFKYGDMLHESS